LRPLLEAGRGDEEASFRRKKAAAGGLLTDSGKKN